MRDAKGNHYSAHLRHSPFRSGPEKSEGARHEEPTDKTEERGDREAHGGEEHTSKTHGTQPHPVTGVHAVHIHHHGGGKAKTYTHHDGGRIEEREHESLDEAKAHADEQLPSDRGDEQPNDEYQGQDEGTESEYQAPGSLGSIGSMGE